MNINNIRERRAILILILILYTKNYVLCILCIKYNNIWFWGEYFLFLFLCSVFVAKVCAIHMLELFSLSGFWVLFLCLPTAFFSPFCFVLYVTMCVPSLSLFLSLVLRVLAFVCLSGVVPNIYIIIIVSVIIGHVFLYL